MTAPAQGGATLPTVEDPSPIGGVRPRIADLRNRLVVVQPLSIARNVPGVQPGTTQDRITANVFVLDGGPLEFGGKPEKYVPHTLVVPTPYLAEGVYISQTNLVTALEKSLPSPQKPQGGLVIGVITQGVANNPQHNPPWNLATLDQADPRRAFAAQMLQQFFTGQFRNPEPQQTGAPTPPGGMLAYTHAATMPHDPRTGQPIPNVAEFSVPVQQLQDQVQQDYSRMQAAQYAYAPPAQPAAAGSTGFVPAYQTWSASQQPAQPAQPAAAGPQADPAYQAWLASQQQAQSAPVPAAAPVQPTGNGPAPTGWPQEAWDRLTPEQAGQIRAASAPAAGHLNEPPF